MTNGNVLWLTAKFALICLIVVIALWSTLCIGSPVNCAAIFTLGKAAELLRFGNNPIAPSYNEEAMAVHYRQKHLGETANLKFEIYEAFYICKKSP